MGSGWTSNEIEQLKKLWGNSDMSAATIGSMLGKSRNAVLGKVHRLKLPNGGSQPRANRRKVPRTPKRITAPGVREPKTAGNVASTDIGAPKPAPKSVPLLGEPEPKMIPLEELTDRVCKWPIGDPVLGRMGAAQFGFCGHPVHGKSTPPYCSFHAKAAYVTK